LTLQVVHTPAQFTQLAKLYQAYADGLGIDLGFQDFSSELNELAVMYGSPTGCAWIIYDEELPIACVGIRLFSSTVAELKRMYVNPDYRRRGVAQQLMDVSLMFAKQAGYQSVRLDTLCTMIPAMTLYRKNGFIEIPAYYHNPIETAVYFEKIL